MNHSIIIRKVAITVSVSSVLQAGQSGSHILAGARISVLLDQPWGPANFLYTGAGSFLRVKWPESGADHLSHANARLWMCWSCISATPLCLHGHVVRWSLPLPVKQLPRYNHVTIWVSGLFVIASMITLKAVSDVIFIDIVVFVDVKFCIKLCSTGMVITKTDIWKILLNTVNVWSVKLPVPVFFLYAHTCDAQSLLLFWRNCCLVCMVKYNLQRKRKI